MEMIVDILSAVGLFVLVWAFQLVFHMYKLRKYLLANPSNAPTPWATHLKFALTYELYDSLLYTAGIGVLCWLGLPLHWALPVVWALVLIKMWVFKPAAEKWRDTMLAAAAGR